MRWSQSDLNAYEARHAKTGRVAAQPASSSIEREVQEEIKQECARRGWICNGSRMDLPTTTIPGSPDFWILRDGGRLLLIECKRPSGGKLSREQLGYHAWARKLGHEVHVVRSLTEFLEVINHGKIQIQEEVLTKTDA